MGCGITPQPFSSGHAMRISLRRALGLGSIVLAHAVTISAEWPAEPTAHDRATTTISAQVREPARRKADTPPPAPPALPAGLDQTASLTIRAKVERLAGAPRESRMQQVSRTPSRVHVSFTGGSEWLFERNAVDPRRVSGWLVDHAARAIITYEESELRMTMGIRGWADVFMLGFDPTPLEGIAAAGPIRTISGVRFERYEPSAGVPRSLALWWNQHHLLATEFTTTDGRAVTRISIQEVREGVDAGLLRLPLERFPGFKEFDLAEWLER
jgi:hypothetical protein